MQIPSALVSGVNGFNSAQSGLIQATIDVARAPALDQLSQGKSGSDTPDIAAALVAAIGAVHQAQASANVIQSADETLGTLIDIKV